MIYKKLKFDLKADAIFNSPFIYLGEYDSNTVYQKSNIVSYQNKTYVYYSAVAASNIPPTTTTHWTEVGLAITGLAPERTYTKEECDAKFGDKATQETNSTNITNLENTTAKKAQANTFTQQNTFNERVNILNDKELWFGWTPSDIKLKFGTGSANKEGIVNAPAGDLKLMCKNGNNITINQSINANNKTVWNLKDPTNPQDCANKRYVDSKFSSVNPSNLAKLDQSNEYTGINKFKNKVQVLLDNNFEIGYTDGDIKLEFKPEAGTKNGRIEANQGQLRLYGKNGVASLNSLDLTQNTIYNLREPQNANEAATKSYVDSEVRRVHVPSVSRQSFRIDSSGGDFTYDRNNDLYYKDVNISNICGGYYEFDRAEGSVNNNVFWDFSFNGSTTRLTVKFETRKQSYGFEGNLHITTLS